MTVHPAEDAVREFWNGIPGRPSGQRGWRALLQTAIDEMVRRGLDRSSIHTNLPLQLPGSYHTPSQHWNILIIDGDIPVAALDITFCTAGRHLRNRMDDILSRSTNVTRAYDQPLVRALRPVLGQLFLLEEHGSPTESLHPPGIPESTSHQNRLTEFFRRLLRDGQYDAIWYFTSRFQPDITIDEPSAEMGFTTFVEAMMKRIEEVREARQRHGLSADDLGMLLAQRDDLRFGREIAERKDIAGVVAGISSVDTGRAAVDLDVIQRRRQILAELRQLVLDPATTEPEIQKLIGKRYWIFGGQYIGVLEKRDIISLDEHDIPLICADRSIHVIELKRPKNKLVRKHRNHQIVSNDVHEAVAQCMNYLRGFDELGASHQTYYHNELGLDYDLRRAKGTVIIGHPELTASDGVTREQVEQTIRSYNAHLSRVQVITFADLVDSAERALAFEAEEHSER